MVFYSWSSGYGDATPQEGWGVAVDTAGNVIITGNFDGITDFGGGPLASAGGGDIFLAKFDASGAHLWSQHFGDSDFEFGSRLATDASGAIFVTGRFRDSLDFGAGPMVSAGSADIFLAKFDPGGARLWSQRFGGTGFDEPWGVDTDQAGNVVLVGDFQNTVDFGGGPLVSAGSADIYVAKFDAAGNHIWSKRFGDAAYQLAWSVAIDPWGNVVAAGTFSGTVDFGGGLLASAGGDDIFVAKFDAAGNHIWSNRFGEGDHQDCQWVEMDPSGNIIVTGYFEGTVDFGGGVMSANDMDVFVAKFDPAGSHVWSHRFGLNGLQTGKGVATDGSGNVFVMGDIWDGGIDFGGGPITNVDGRDGFLAHFDSTGAHVWSFGFGEILDASPQGIAVNHESRVAITGFFRGNVYLGGMTLASAGQSDAFAAAYDFAPQAEVSAITDVGNDQGRQVRISFLASSYDEAGSPFPILQYEVFRRIDDLPFPLHANPAAGMSREGMISDAASIAAHWDFVGAIPAHATPEYNTIVATLADSTIAQGMHWSVFFVRAATATPSLYFDSAPDSGYSIDNLAPSVPQGFAVAYNTGSGNRLSWEASSEEDFQFYRVYRSSDPNFTPSVGNLVQSTTLTSWTDPDFDGGGVHYKLTATDFSGNEGDPAVPGIVTGASDGDGLPRRFALYRNVPNPFNPSTVIRYDVAPGGARVTLRIFDVNGTVIRTLVDEMQTAGRKDVVWDGRDDRGRQVSSGVYFYRLSASDFHMSRKMMLLK
jgi:hypothetical protein